MVNPGKCGGGWGVRHYSRHFTRSTTDPGRKGLKERHLEDFGRSFHFTSSLAFQVRSYSQEGNGTASITVTSRSKFKYIYRMWKIQDLDKVPHKT